MRDTKGLSPTSGCRRLGPWRSVFAQLNGVQACALITKGTGSGRNSRRKLDPENRFRLAKSPAMSGAFYSEGKAQLSGAGSPPADSHFENELLDNSLDFVVRAATELWDPNLPTEAQLKYSTIHLWEGIELLLKARLVREHWSLILRDLNRYKAKSFESGDFQSVTYEEACARLEAVCGVTLEQPLKDAFDALRKLRNRYVHFVCNEPPASVMADQLKAWHHALRLLEAGMLRLSRTQQARLDEAQALMLRSEEFLKVRLDAVRGELTEAKTRGLTVLACPRCEMPALILGDGYPDCRVCAKSNEWWTDVADSYARMNNPSWKHPKHGPDDDVAWCECGEQACVPAGEEIGDELQARLAHLRTEPGMDIEPYICFACGSATPDWYLEHCGYCGAQYFDSNEEEDHFPACPACGHF